MKKMNLTIAGFLLLAGFTACNDSETTATTTTDKTTVSSDSNNATTTPPVTNNTTPTPLNSADSTFVMKAAVGGMMEVEAGNMAKANASNERVKAFANMMVNDHSKANAELMSFAGARGLTLPTAMPADMQKHMDAMKKMTGKAFDNHYMMMMVNDHKTDVELFQKQANSGADAELKAWAAKTLPTLQRHKDSATAISKMKM